MSAVFTPEPVTPQRAKAPVRRLRQHRGRAVTSQIALELSELAFELRLTGKQRLLAEELIIRCDGNVTQAAQAAGMALSRAKNVVLMPHFQTFMDALRTAVAGPVAKELELVLYEGAHALARLTEIAEGQVPGSVDRPVTVKAVDGSVKPDSEITQTEHYPILEATRDILAHYKVGAQAGPGGNRTLVINVSKLPPEQLDAIAGNVRAMLSETED